MIRSPSDPIDRAALQALHERERRRYVERHPRSAALAAASAPHFLYGVPLHWMRDWGLPHPLFVHAAEGHRLRCVDGHDHLDFCLGDTGAMFGHSPPPVAKAIAHQAAQGLTAMLPGEALAEVGAALARVFGLPRWQVTLSASDANRFVLRWARAITGRRKVLVFDGCYHGTVDDTLVDRAADGRTLTRASLLGQVHDLALGTVVVPFNDAVAVEAALAAGDVACVLTEPALTNCGLVPPAPGFMAAVQAACRRHGALFVLDETHTVSSGLGGHARVHGLEPDVLVVGKAVAGGLPCAVYGFTDAVAERMAAAKDAAPEGHSGIGTTLAANLLALAALRATLDEVMTAEAYERMLATAAGLEARLRDVIARRGLPWTVTRLGARMELQFCADTPRDAAQARAAMDDALERALHLYLLERGVVITPFHNMLLVPPMATAADADVVAAALDAFVGEVLA
ncbi:MAG: aminotransferase class III-fold pyridoxal phosphate-dependent enzyme [Rubrivivax sp.]|nr:aminotransferase class III-fold pyridoxal phosphate-dependent enzyme [Rubrivivax sp.]